MVTKKQSAATATDVGPDAPDEPDRNDSGIVVEYSPPPSPPKDEATKANLFYWDKLKDVTDTTALKGFTRGGGFTGTDINPTWRMERMTEVFGPVGWGWGYEVVKRWSETFGTKQVVYTTVRCWYVPTNESPYWPKNDEGISDRRNPPINALWTGEQDGGTETSRTPDEAYKQAITDGFGKTSAQIGLASAIYRGKWDDSKYKEDQERFSQIESVKKYLEVLVPELAEMTDPRELQALYRRASFNENNRVAKEADFKLRNEFEAIVAEHENRIVRALWGEVREILKSEDLEAMSAAIDEIKPKIVALPDERGIAELRTLVASRKAELKKAMEPKEEPQDAGKGQDGQSRSDQSRTHQDPTGQAQGAGDFPMALEVPRKDGNPQWGTFTKTVLATIKRAIDERPRKHVLINFHNANQDAFKRMVAAGDQPKSYFERIESDYKAAIEMLED